ncbi:hypothetical protein JMK10_19545, partial [Rhodovulum sulfidophilum]
MATARRTMRPEDRTYPGRKGLPRGPRSARFGAAARQEQQLALTESPRHMRLTACSTAWAAMNSSFAF